MTVCLVWDNRDYYGESLVAIYGSRGPAEEHLQALADRRSPFPGSDGLSIEDFTEHSIEEHPVKLRFDPTTLPQQKAAAGSTGEPGTVPAAGGLLWPHGERIEP